MTGLVVLLWKLNKILNYVGEHHYVKNKVAVYPKHAVSIVKKVLANFVREIRPKKQHSTNKNVGIWFSGARNLPEVFPITKIYKV